MDEKDKRIKELEEQLLEKEKFINRIEISYCEMVEEQKREEELRRKEEELRRKEEELRRKEEELKRK